MAVPHPRIDQVGGRPIGARSPDTRRAPRDAAILLAMRVVRLFASGAISIVLVLFLTAKGLSPSRVGLLLTLTLAVDAALSLWLTTSADRLGRRRTLAAGAALLAATGLVFAMSDSWLWLALAATGGVLSPAGKESGPFLAVEQAALAECAPPARRTHAFAWYQFAASLASAAGSLAGGLTGSALQRAGWSPLAAYRVVFVGYAAAGAVIAALVLSLSTAVEPVHRAARPSGTRWGLHRSRTTVLTLSRLFAVDAFAGGMIVQSLVAYWLAEQFGASEAAIGSLAFGMGVLSAASAPASAWIAARFGLVRTMVFTHLPSNALLCLLPLSTTFAWASLVLLVRASLSQMDVPTRQSFVVAGVDADERSAAAGVTGVARSLGSAAGPAVGGALMAAWLGAPFVAAGIIKSVYDALLFLRFRSLKPPEERVGPARRSE
jgi:predicted MFS family arabinose efflux permease